jgi:hypothetical protein
MVDVRRLVPWPFATHGAGPERDRVGPRSWRNPQPRTRVRFALIAGAIPGGAIGLWAGWSGQQGYLPCLQCVLWRCSRCTIVRRPRDRRCYRQESWPGDRRSCACCHLSRRVPRCPGCSRKRAEIPAGRSRQWLGAVPATSLWAARQSLSRWDGACGFLSRAARGVRREVPPGRPVRVRASEESGASGAEPEAS